MTAKLLLIVTVLLGIQTYGVYGGAQAQRLSYDCKVSFSILCFSWEKNKLGSFLESTENSDELEKTLAKEQKEWEQRVVENVSRSKGRIEELFRTAGSKIQEQVDDFLEAIMREVENN